MLRVNATREEDFACRIGPHAVNCQVRYSARRRRSIALRVLGPDRVRINAPGHYSHQAVLDFLHSRTAWLQRQLDRLSQPSPWSTTAHHNSQHPFQGQAMTLVWQRGDGKRLRISGKPPDLCLNIPHHWDEATAMKRAAAALKRWYRQQAEQRFHQRLAHWMRHIDWLDKAPELKLRTMISRWGSCSAKGRITLNTQLIKTPPECLDYVIVHELCHLREMNHGPAFYRLQAAILPDWQQRKQQLTKFPLPAD